jgi:hypothetical protein
MKKVSLSVSIFLGVILVFYYLTNEFPPEMHYQGTISWGDHDSLRVDIAERGNSITTSLIPAGQDGDVKIIGTTQAQAWQGGRCKWGVTITGRKGVLVEYLPDCDREEVFDAAKVYLNAAMREVYNPHHRVND